MTTKIHYLDGYGRAEPMRFLLTHAKADYEDVVISYETLAQYKADGFAEFGQVPIIEKDGLRLVQTWSILRYLGTQLGYYPGDAESAYKIDTLLSGVEDWNVKLWISIYDKNEAKKAQYLEEFLVYMRAFIKLVNQRLIENESQLFIVGNKMTIADMALATVVFDSIENTANPLYSQLQAVYKKGDYPVFDAYFENLAIELQTRLKSRPSRPF